MSTPLRERPDAPLGTLIFRAGLLPAETIESALEEGVKTGKRLGEILTDRGLISEVDLARLLAGQKGLDFVTLREQIVDPAAAALFTEEQARLFRALPFAFDGELPVVAIADPTDDVLMRNIREALGRESARFVVAARGELAEIATDVYSRPLPPAAGPPPEAEPDAERSVEPEAEAELEPEPEPEVVAEHTNGTGPVDADLIAYAPPLEPEPPALPELEPEEAPETVAFEPEPEPDAEPEPVPLVLQVPVPNETALPEPAAPPLPEPFPAAAAEPLPSLAVEPAQPPEPEPVETPEPVTLAAQAPSEPLPAPEPVAEAQAPLEQPAAPLVSPPVAHEPLGVAEPAPLADPAPAPEPAPAFVPTASPEPVPLPQPPEPPPAPYPPAAFEPEPAPAPTPEQLEAPAPTPAAPSAWRLTIRLTNSERVEGGDFPDEEGAKQEARSIMTQIADADAGEWPFVNGRFLKPDTIVSVDIAELADDPAS
jgi:hypothetical protein